MKVKCLCGYEWNYKANKFYCTCPSCKRSLKITYGIKYFKNKLKCEKCKKDKNLEIHHIIQRQQGGTDGVENLKLLCHDCHVKIKKSSRIAKDRKIIKLNETFTDKEFKELLKAKGDLSWHNFIMSLVIGKK